LTAPKTAPSIRDTRELLSRGDVTTVEHLGSTLDAIRAAEPGLGAFLAVAGDEALRDAEVADVRIGELGAAAWRERPLLGVTVAVKDLIQTVDLPTTRGSLLRNRRSRFDPPAVARLRAAGAIVVGKTATSEGGWSASTVSPIAGPTGNPWAPERTAGGSSGGSAAAVAAGLCTAALGTDGAGSIRIPAAFCGVVGFKPSFGRIPYVPPCADRLSHLGPIAGNVSDVIELMAVLQGPHRDDPDSLPGSLTTRREPEGLRIGWIEFPGTSAPVREASERMVPVLTGLGHRVDRIEVPFADPYRALVDIVAASEAAGTRPEDEERIDPGRLAVVRYGRTVSGAAVTRTEEVRLALRTTLSAVMASYDLLAMATVPIEPFDRYAIGPAGTERPEDLSWLAWSPATYPFNLTCQPALSLPVGLTAAGLPVGVQLVGPVGADELVLSAALRAEAELGPLPLPVPADRIPERML
jgi:aspartyl-tRNA(Asn)/glutamyl-tRNA(Gln) amidotransferase subunit A